MVTEPAGIYLFKVKKRKHQNNVRIRSKLTKKIPDFDYISNYFRITIVDFEQVNIC